MSDVHPNSARLEEVAVGGQDAEVAAHLTKCDACRAYVDRLRAGADAFAKEPEQNVASFLSAVEARAVGNGDAAGGDAASDTPEAAIDPVVRPLLWMRVAWVAAPLAAAALFMFLVRPPPPALDDGASPQATAPNLTSTLSPIHFKGGPQIAVVVDHEGHQSRETGRVRAGPGDRLRIEVSLDEEGPVVAGILESDGTWTPLLPAALLEAGTHYSDEAARLDDAGAEGFILAGRPDAVERARRTHDFTGIAVLPLVPMR